MPFPGAVVAPFHITSDLFPQIGALVTLRNETKIEFRHVFYVSRKFQPVQTQIVVSG